MPNRAPSVDWSRIAKAIAGAFVAVWLVVAVTDPAMGWIIPIALGSGALIALVLIATQSRSRDAIPSPDSFAGRGNNIIDISSVRVAGLGSLGLVIVSGIVALQFQLIGAAMIAGAIGGAVAGIVMILHRRRHDAATA
jgi:hypothetical protein